MAKFLKEDPGTLPHLRWSSWQQLVLVETCKGLHLLGLQPNKQYLHFAVVARPSSQPELKTNENSHAWKVALDTLSCFVDMFFTFF